MSLTFKEWLDQGRGRAVDLASKLGVSKSAITQAASGDMRVPPTWYAVILRESEGAVSIESLLPPERAAA